MDKLTQNILEQIKSEKIKPRPRWEFLLRRYVVYALFGLNLVFGSIGAAISIFLITHNEVLFDPQLATNLVQWLVLAFPIIWIIFTVISLWVAYYNFKHSEKGYRYNVAIIMFVSVVISFSLGIILNVLGFAAQLNYVFSQNLGFYNQMFDTRAQVWMRPEQGFLAGKIDSIDDQNKTLQLIDLNGKVWTVDMSEAVMRSRMLVIAKDKNIKIIGKQTVDGRFKASEVRPWDGMMQGSMMRGGMLGK